MHLCFGKLKNVYAVCLQNVFKKLRCDGNHKIKLSWSLRMHFTKSSGFRSGKREVEFFYACI